MNNDWPLFLVAAYLVLGGWVIGYNPPGMLSMTLGLLIAISVEISIIKRQVRRT